MGPTVYTYGPSTLVIGIVIDSAGNHWVSDESCSGNVYENRVFYFSAGDGIQGITISTLNPSKKAHLYVAVTNGCDNYPYPFVGDVNDLTILPHLYSSNLSDDMPGLSTDYSYAYLWFTTDYA